MALPPLKIANIMGAAADKKSRGMKPSKSNPDPDHDGDNDMSPQGDTDHDFAGKRSPKQVAAAKEQEKAKGKQPPKSAKKPMPPQGGAPQGY